MLPLCLGASNQFFQYLLDADKIYLVKVRLGIRTAGIDSEAEIISQYPVLKLLKHKFEKTLKLSYGVIKVKQSPGMSLFIN